MASCSVDWNIRRQGCHGSQGKRSSEGLPQKFAPKSSNGHVQVHPSHLNPSRAAFVVSFGFGWVCCALCDTQPTTSRAACVQHVVRKGSGKLCWQDIEIGNGRSAWSAGRHRTLGSKESSSGAAHHSQAAATACIQPIEDSPSGLFFRQSMGTNA